MWGRPATRALAYRSLNPGCIDTTSWGSFLRSLAIAKSDSSVRLRAAPLNLVEALSKIAA